MKIQLKRSNVLDSGAAKQPTASQLEYGELAVNYNTTDPAIFLKDSNNNVIRISGVGNISDDGLTNVPDGTTPPSNPESGNLWYNSDQGRLYIYFEDADTSQWVDASPDSWDPTVLPDTSNAAQQSGTLDDRYVVKGANSGNVGIGVNSPISTLDIIGTTTSRLSDNTKGVQITNDGAVEIWRTGGNPFIDFKSSRTEDFDCRIQQSSDGLAISTGGQGNTAERLLIDSTGNIGVGTNSPDAKLEVVASGSGYHPAIELTNSGGSGSIIRSKRGLLLEADYESNSGTSESEIVFKTDGSQRMVIDPSGNIGVGTAAPAQRLHTIGPATSASNLTNPLLLSNIGTHTNSGHKQGEGVSIGFQLKRGTDGATTNTAFIKAEAEADLGSSWPTALTFGTQRFGSDPEEHLRIASDGSVSIGTNNPQSILHVQDSAGAVIKLGNGTTSGNSVQGLDFYGRFISGTTPSYPGQLTSYIREERQGDNAEFELTFGTSTSSDASERMRIDSSGKVGIGTSSPDRLVHIFKGEAGTALSDGNTALMIENSSHAIIQMASPNNSSNRILFGDPQDADAGSLIYDHSINEFTVRVNALERMRIDSSGNVGIGTTNPVADLVVSNGGASGIELQPEIATNTNRITNFSRSGSSYNNFRLDAAQHEFLISGSEKMRIDSSGRLLMQSSSAPTQGVYSQYAPLTVQGYIGSTTGNGILNVARGTTASNLSSGSDIGTVVFSDSAGGEFGRISCFADAAPGSNDYPGRISFHTTADGASSPTERMQIDSSGRLLVGTLTTSAAASAVFEDNSANNGPSIVYLSSSATTPADGAGLGLVRFSASNHSPTTQIAARRDGGTWTAGSSQPSRMEFSTTANGASSPTERMRITSVGDVQARRARSNTSGDVALSIQPSDSTIHYGFRIDQANNNLNLDRADNNSTLLTVTGTGKLGIGDNSPDALLVIKGNSDAATTPSIRLKDGTDTREAWITNSAGDLSLNVGGNDNVAHATFKMFESGILDYAQGASSRLHIDSSGNVRIGPNGGALLTVTKDTGTGVINLADFYAPNASQNGLIRMIHRNAANTGTSSIDFYKAYQDGFRVVNNDTAASNYTSLEVGGSERMRVTSAGNVGIGTTTVDEKLHVESSDATVRLKVESTAANSYPGVRFTNDAKTYDLQIDGATDALRVYDASASTERMRIDSSGNVGIGTNSATEILEAVASSPTVCIRDTNTSITTASAALRLAESGAGNSVDNYWDLVADNTAGNFGFCIKEGADTRIAIKPGTGNIGLGTIAPSSKLDIFESSSSTTPAKMRFVNQGERAVTVGFDDHNASPVFSVSSGDQGTKFVSIDSSGNVGINETSPSSTLDVNGSLSKNSGSFKIDHPLPALAETHHLVHSFVEAPDASNLYAGMVDLVDGRATVNIDTAHRMTEGTFEALNTIQSWSSSNESGYAPVKCSISGNLLTIECQDSTSTDTVYYEVRGVRKDQHMLDTEWTDENGIVITEPLKSAESNDTDL